jgi:hypothetical protein
MLTFSPFVKLLEISKIEINGTFNLQWNCSYEQSSSTKTPKTDPSSDGSGLKLTKFNIKEEPSFFKVLKNESEISEEIVRNIYSKPCLTYILKSSKYPILYVGITEVGLKRGVFSSSGRLAHHIRKIYAMIGPGTNHTHGWRPHAVTRYKDLKTHNQNNPEELNLLQLMDDLEISFGFFSSNQINPKDHEGFVLNSISDRLSDGNYLLEIMNTGKMKYEPIAITYL